MDIASLKKYIFENNKVEHVLKSIGCHDIRYDDRSNYYYAAFPDGDNPKGVCIYNTEYLSFSSLSRGIRQAERKDIANLVMYVKKYDFVRSVKYLHNILGFDYEPYKKDRKKDKEKEADNPLSIFKKILGRSKARRSYVDTAELRYLDEELVNDYVPLLYVGWFKERIMPWAAKRFGICYSYRHKRVVIPLRHWETGRLLGFNQRTVVDNYQEFGIQKYFITPAYKKSMNVYGLYENREEIENKKYCVIVEAEKSVLKRSSCMDNTCVALQGKTLSQEQRRIILGLDVNEIVIALDKDVDINEVRHMCEQFWRLRKTSYILDEDNVLGDKDSPCDADVEGYNKLFESRILYDESEHEKYLKSLKK